MGKNDSIRNGLRVDYVFLPRLWCILTFNMVINVNVKSVTVGFFPILLLLYTVGPTQLPLGNPHNRGMLRRSRCVLIFL